MSCQGKESDGSGAILAEVKTGDVIGTLAAKQGKNAT